MKAIIVGKNGRKSIIEVLKMMKDPNVYAFIKRDNNTWIRSHWYSGTIHKTSVVKPSFSEGDIIVKWGNSIPVGTGNCIYYNNGLAVNNASNKLEARFLMEEAGIPVPETYGLVDDVKSYPVVVRPIKHRAGKYFYIANDTKQLKSIILKHKSLNNGYYMSNVFKKDREFRLHCAFGKVLVIKEKPAPKDKNIVAWNFAINEEAWTTIDRKDYSLEMCKIALRSMDAVGLDIGAVDVMSKGNEHIICEINTAPSLTDYLAEKYALLFEKIFREPNKIKNWEYEGFTKNTSMSWKNYQLTGKKQ